MKRTYVTAPRAAERRAASEAAAAAAAVEEVAAAAAAAKSEAVVSARRLKWESKRVPKSATGTGADHNAVDSDSDAKGDSGVGGGDGDVDEDANSDDEYEYADEDNPGEGERDDCDPDEYRYKPAPYEFRTVEKARIKAEAAAAKLPTIEQFIAAQLPSRASRTDKDYNLGMAKVVRTLFLPPAPVSIDATDDNDPYGFGKTVSDCMFTALVIKGACSSGGVGGWLPIAPVIDIVIRYALYWACTTTEAGFHNSQWVADAEFTKRYGSAMKTYDPALVNGARHDARFAEPNGIMIWIDPSDSKREKSLLICDTANNVIRHQLANGTVDTFAGSNTKGFQNGCTAAEAQFIAPRHICVDPTNANRLFLCDQYSVRVVERSTDSSAKFIVSLLAGGDTDGSADGTGSNAKFSGPESIVVTRDGTRLFVADTQNQTIRRIEVASKAVSTLVRMGEYSSPCPVPRALAFDTATNGWESAPESYLLVGCGQGGYGIRRVDMKTGEVENPTARNSSITGIVCLPQLGLIVASDWNRLIVFDPNAPKEKYLHLMIWASPKVIAGGDLHTGAVNGTVRMLDEENATAVEHYDRTTGRQIIETRAGFGLIAGVCYDPSAECVLVADSSLHVIRRVQLPLNLLHYRSNPLPPPPAPPCGTATADATSTYRFGH